jgi:FAD/FMN-containing dehydrogenase
MIRSRIASARVGSPNTVQCHNSGTTATQNPGAAIHRAYALADMAAVTDRLHVAAVTGTCSAVGMAGLTLGGGYGPLIGRFGLALDNLWAAQVVLADCRRRRLQ